MIRVGRPPGHYLDARVGGTRALPIPLATYRELKAASEDLLECLKVEEAYEVMILNYLELEKAMMTSVVDFMADRQTSRAALDRARREMDRQLVNLLASGEMYSEHARKTAKRLQRTHRRRHAGDNIPDAVEASLAEQRQRLLGLRAAEALRDQVLHLSLPVTGWVQYSEWTEGEASRLTYSFSVHFAPGALASDRRGADPDLVAALRARAGKGGHVSWLPIAREYVEGLSHVHHALRLALQPVEAICLAAIDDQIRLYREETSVPDSLKGMMAVVEVTTDGARSDHAIDFEFSARVEDIRSRTRAPMTNLHKRQIVEAKH